jgi:hypothetical protein
VCVVARKRARLSQETKSITLAPAPVQPLALFGPPLLLLGEDDAAYGELLARICAVVKPADVIEEMFAADVVFLQWEILRLRRLKSSLLKTSGHKALVDFLGELVNYDLYREDFEQTLAETLQVYFAESQAEEFSRELARRYAREEPDAVEQVDEILSAEGLGRHDFLQTAMARKVERLARAYARREPDAIKEVNETLAARNCTMDDLMTNALADRFSGDKLLTTIERIDRLTLVAETRRNASLREIDRHRAVFGEALRRNLQEVEDGEFKVIESASAEGKSAA